MIKKIIITQHANGFSVEGDGGSEEISPKDMLMPLLKTYIRIVDMVVGVHPEGCKCTEIPFHSKVRDAVMSVLENFMKDNIEVDEKLKKMFAEEQGEK